MRWNPNSTPAAHMPTRAPLFDLFTIVRRYKKTARTVASSFENFLENLEPNPDANW